MDFDFEGSRGSVRGKYEAQETVRGNDARARRERIEAEAVRNRLEKCGSVGARSNFLGSLTAMAAVDALASRSVEGTLDALRRCAQLSPMQKAAAEPDLAGNDPPMGDRYTSDLRAERVRDAAGSVQGDDAGGRHFADGEPEAVVARWLLAEAKRLIAAVNTRRFSQNRV